MKKVQLQVSPKEVKVYSQVPHSQVPTQEDKKAYSKVLPKEEYKGKRLTGYELR